MRPRFVVLASVLQWTLWTCGVVLVLASALPDHPLRPTPRVSAYFFSVTPEAWRFFTRSAREPMEHVYANHDGYWRVAIRPNTAAVNAFGFRKHSRLQTLEIGYVTSQVPADAWLECEQTVFACVRQDRARAVSVENRAALPTLCGDLLVERRPLVPWAWSRSGERVNMPGQYVRLAVRCVPSAPTSNGGPERST